MNPAPVFTFTCPVKTNSGNKALEHLPVELAGLNAANPLIITSAKSVGQKAIQTLIDAFGDSGMTLGLCDGVTTTANLDLIEHLKSTYLEKKYDALIALGGYGVVDTAKVLNLAVSLKTADARKLSPATPVRGHLPPLVVVPTAAACGLETSKFAHFNKTIYASEYLAPNLVVIDPRLTKGSDGKTIAATGLAALGRAVEAQISTDNNPFRDAYSFAAIRFVKENLQAAVQNPGNKKASLAVLNASSMAGSAASDTKSARLHKLGQVFYDIQHIPQGVIMGMCLPIVLGDYLKEGSGDLSALLHPLVGDDEYSRTPAAKRAETALSVLGRFISDLYGSLGKDLPRNLKEAAIPNYMMEDILDVLGQDEEGLYLKTVVERITG
jgi:alcohol dehydrogenase